MWIFIAAIFLQVYGVFSQECGGELTHNNGIIKSPNYPNSYPTNTRCQWLIKPLNGMAVNFTIVSLKLDKLGDGSSVDSLKIFDSDVPDDPSQRPQGHPRWTFTGTVGSGMTFTTRAKRIMVVFESNGRTENPKQGFSVTYFTFHPPTCDGEECNTRTSSTSTTTTPSTTTTKRSVIVSSETTTAKELRPGSTSVKNPWTKSTRLLPTVTEKSTRNPETSTGSTRTSMKSTQLPSTTMAKSTGKPEASTKSSTILPTTKTPHPSPTPSSAAKTKPTNEVSPTTAELTTGTEFSSTSQLPPVLNRPGGLHPAAIAAAVLLPILALALCGLLGFLVWYRKRYPVRMHKGRHFGKFTNPAYEVKRTSTLTLLREKGPSDEICMRRVGVDNMGFEEELLPNEIKEHTDQLQNTSDLQIIDEHSNKDNTPPDPTNKEEKQDTFQYANEPSTQDEKIDEDAIQLKGTKGKVTGHGRRSRKQSVQYEHNSLNQYIRNDPLPPESPKSHPFTKIDETDSAPIQSKQIDPKKRSMSTGDFLENIPVTDLDDDLESDTGFSKACTIHPIRTYSCPVTSTEFESIPFKGALPGLSYFDQSPIPVTDLDDDIHVQFLDTPDVIYNSNVVSALPVTDLDSFSLDSDSSGSSSVHYTLPITDLDSCSITNSENSTDSSSSFHFTFSPTKHDSNNVENSQDNSISSDQDYSGIHFNKSEVDLAIHQLEDAIEGIPISSSQEDETTDKQMAQENRKGLPNNVVPSDDVGIEIMGKYTKLPEQNSSNTISEIKTHKTELISSEDIPAEEQWKINHLNESNTASNIPPLPSKVEEPMPNLNECNDKYVHTFKGLHESYDPPAISKQQEEEADDTKGVLFKKVDDVDKSQSLAHGQKKNITNKKTDGTDLKGCIFDVEVSQNYSLDALESDTPKASSTLDKSMDGVDVPDGKGADQNIIQNIKDVALEKNVNGSGIDIEVSKDYPNTMDTSIPPKPLETPHMPVKDACVHDKNGNDQAQRHLTPAITKAMEVNEPDLNDFDIDTKDTDRYPLGLRASVTPKASESSNMLRNGSAAPDNEDITQNSEGIPASKKMYSSEMDNEVSKKHPKGVDTGISPKSSSTSNMSKDGFGVQEDNITDTIANQKTQANSYTTEMDQPDLHSHNMDIDISKKSSPDAETSGTLKHSASSNLSTDGSAMPNDTSNDENILLEAQAVPMLLKYDNLSEQTDMTHPKLAPDISDSQSASSKELKGIAKGANSVSTLPSPLHSVPSKMDSTNYIVSDKVDTDVSLHTLKKINPIDSFGESMKEISPNDSYEDDIKVTTPNKTEDKAIKQCPKLNIMNGDSASIQGKENKVQDNQMQVDSITEASFDASDNLSAPIYNKEYTTPDNQAPIGTITDVSADVKELPKLEHSAGNQSDLASLIAIPPSPGTSVNHNTISKGALPRKTPPLESDSDSDYSLPSNLTLGDSDDDSDFDVDETLAKLGIMLKGSSK